MGAVARTPLGTASCIKRAASRKKDHMGCLREMDAERCGGVKDNPGLFCHTVLFSLGCSLPMLMGLSWRAAAMAAPVPGVAATCK